MSSHRRRFPVYERVLKLYPAAYRKEYETQMLQTLSDMLADAPSPTARMRIKARLLIDVPSSLIQQQVQYIGGNMTSNMPAFVKRNAAISALLLVPFMLAVLANSTDQVIRHQTLYNSWAWSTPVLRMWVLWMPAAAAIIAAGSLIAYIFRRIRVDHASARNALFQLQYSWPLVITCLGGIFVLALLFGHDSVHCVTGNPINELQHWPATWHCIQRG